MTTSKPSLDPGKGECSCACHNPAVYQPHKEGHACCDRAVAVDEPVRNAPIQDLTIRDILEETLNDLAVASYYKGKGNKNISLDEEVKTATHSLNQLILREHIDELKKLHNTQDVAIYSELQGDYIGVDERIAELTQSIEGDSPITLCKCEGVDFINITYCQLHKTAPVRSTHTEPKREGEVNGL